ncbi:hypothetical protein QGN23_07335 [Chryseobacterium gotjawalense]|uniref:Transposase n=1 Tax=Chryseobacterium gotjawalense TaxID=3042315 RepID=A0ABY8RGG7_9FLAO|nr:hypothetical protein [Chryseobacterium sp. wdc7]WHF53075.1 hypothetical protein QGN23_07335 [Chryseobacterium sp. wdc7]
MGVIDDAFSGFLGKIPCHNTIENWVKKSGLKAYETSGEELQGTQYAQIVDESMMIGSEKLLLTLGVPAYHQGKPLDCSNSHILNIAVAESWNGDRIGKQLKTAAQKIGYNPLYVISDNASVMKKGIRVAELCHQLDISHSLGMFLERTYKKEPDFVAYLKAMADCKFKFCMKKIAYLLPPTQRTVARFLNISQWVNWSSKILAVYHTLNKEEQKVFSFIPANASLIDELTEVIKCVNSIEKRCKNKGLSQQTVSKCQQEIKRHLLCGSFRMIALGESISKFLAQEVIIITSNAAHHNSSDIIESIFGKYKARKSPNKLNGVTSFVLFLPLYTKLSNKAIQKEFNFKKALEDTLLSQIKVWEKEHLTKNLTQMRTKCFQNAA